ncbi:restriction endonuclease subunit S [Domibacillus sp. PGB-M46]|uniref:restriction endonuclease subunit S n=1 Tax=Domibacillus sp. PGB-M46 TaxID=2910255 RepID=UPI001F595A29|nr:restriction endonuclease subunit S [Domibacillus sp. PGB-M46]MCI2255531.1 restriction endonuclease subunit S [Domibacillus sp. PGB-M46]
MSEWKEVSLKDISFYNKERISLEQINFSNYVSTENMNPDRNGVTNASSLPSSKTVSKYCAGDILISNIRPYFKKIWFADKDGGCSNDVLVIRSKDKEQVDSKYLYYCLFTDNFFDYVMSGAKGAKMPRGDKEEIMKYSLLLPPLHEQQQIARFLSNVDDKILMNNKINQTLHDMSAALYKNWFVDFGPFQDNDFEESELGTIPAGWKTKKLSELLYLSKKGITPKYTEDIEGSVLVINQKCIRNKKISTSLARRHDLIKNIPKDKYLQKYDILINSTGIGTLGRVAQLFEVREPITVDSHVRICRPNVEICSPLYIGQVMKMNESLLQTMTEGSTGQAELSSEVLNLQVVYPPLNIQKDYENIVNDWYLITLENERENSVLVSLRDFLLPRLISGTIELKEVEKQVEEVL